MTEAGGAPTTLNGAADLHVHTTYSDGADNPSDVLAWAARVGMNVIAITDHDTIDGAIVAAELARVREGPEVIIGEEVSSREGHILGLFITKLVPADMSATETVDAIHDQGGLAVAPHPYWRISNLDYRGRRFGLGDLIKNVPFDAVETINGGLTPSMLGANLRAGWVAAALGNTAVGGSDAHVKQAIGGAHTCFRGTTARQLRKSILKGITRPGRSRVSPTAVGRYATWSLSRLRLEAAG